MSGWRKRSQVAFAQQEGTAFVSGNGTNKPKGFLDYTKVANGSLELGQYRLRRHRHRRRLRRDDPSDDLIDLIYALKSELPARTRIG